MGTTGITSNVSVLPYQHANEPREHQADSEQRDSNPKRRPVAFTCSVHNRNDQRNQCASKTNLGDHEAPFVACKWYHAIESLVLAL
jgi:hypothetical protein